MEITKPDYFDRFHCIASRCPDSCCKEWDVQVDAEAAAYYRALPGALGDRLRQVLKDEDGEALMTIVDGRCPMWREDGLCRIQAELGETALCTVCREFPRLHHDYGDFVELGLELSCPEAARLILNDSNTEMICVQTEEAGVGDYDEEAMACLKATRAAALGLLDGDPARALAGLLLFGYRAQEALDGGELEDFHPDAAWEVAVSMANRQENLEFFSFFKDLEVLTDKWKTLLDAPQVSPLPPKTLALARYLVQRYWLQAVADYDLVGRVKFIVIACLLVGSLSGDFEEAAQLFSKEIENDADNVDAILDGAYESPAFTDDKLLGMLLEREIS